MLEVLGRAPVSEGVLNVVELAEGEEAVGEASEIVGVETEVGKTFSSATAAADRLVDAKEPNDDVVEAVVVVEDADETAVVALLSVVTVVVVETVVELSELADSVDAAAADEVDAAAVEGVAVAVEGVLTIFKSSFLNINFLT